MAGLDALERLNDPRPAVRRIAALDVLRDGDDAALARLATHLERERDDRCTITMARGLARRCAHVAREALARVRDDATRPVAVSHAALLAHDALEVAARPAPPPPVVDPADIEPSDDAG